MAAYPGYSLQMKLLFCGWPVVVHDTHTRRRRHIRTDKVQLLVCRITCQRSPSPAGNHEIWNRYTVAAVATSETLSQQTDVTVRDVLSHVWKLFLYIQNCKFLMYADVIEDAKQRMQTKSSGIHTSLVAIRREKTCTVMQVLMTRRPSMLLRVACGRLDQLTWTAHLSMHLTRRLGHTVHEGDEYIVTRRHACMH